MENRSPIRKHTIVIKMRPHERANVEQAAEQQGVWMAEFARKAVMEAAREVLGESALR